MLWIWYSHIFLFFFFNLPQVARGKIREDLADGHHIWDLTELTADKSRGIATIWSPPAQYGSIHSESTENYSCLIQSVFTPFFTFPLSSQAELWSRAALQTASHSPVFRNTFSFCYMATKKLCPDRSAT